MNLYGNITKEFVSQWQARASPLHSSMADPPGWDGAVQALSREREHLAFLAKKHRYEAIVSAVAHSVHQSTSLQGVLENAVEAMRTHIERIDAIDIVLWEGEEAELKAHTGLPDWVIAQIQRLPSPQGYTWKVMHEGQPRYCADVDQDAFIHPAGRAFGIQSYVSIPLSAEGRTVGAININSLQKHAFDDDELRLLEILSAHLETAINSAQQAEALGRALAEVERLKNWLQAENVYLRKEITTTHHHGEIIGQVPRHEGESVHHASFSPDSPGCSRLALALLSYKVSHT